MILELSSVLMLDFCFFSNRQVLNQIVCELPSEHPLSETRPLRELLGHTPTQVCSDVLFLCILLFFGKMQAMALALWLHGCQLNLELAVPTSPYPNFTWQDMFICYQHHAASSAPPCSCGIHSWTNLFLYICCWLLECLIAPRWLLARCLGVQ